MEKQHKFSIWYALIAVWGVLFLHNYIASCYQIQVIPYSEFLKLLKENKITEVAVRANQIQGKFKQEDKVNQFRTVRVDHETSKLLEQLPIATKKPMRY